MLSLEKKILISCCAALLALVGVNLECYRQARLVAHANAELNQSQQTLVEIKGLENAFLKSRQQSAGRAPGEPGAGRTAANRVSEAQIRGKLADLKKVGASEALSDENIWALERAINHLYPPKTGEQGAAAVPADKEQADKSFATAQGALAELSQEQERKLAWRSSAANQAGAGNYSTIVLAGLVQLGLLLLGYLLLRKDARRLQVGWDERAQLLNCAGAGFYGIDANGLCTFINKTGSELLGYDPKELVGQSIHKLTRHSRADGTPLPEDACRILHTARSGVAQPNNPLVPEVFWRKSGASFPVELDCCPVSGPGGGNVGAVVSFRDLSAAQQVAVELENARQTGLQVLRLKSEFLANMSHEIRTPMNAILGMAGLLEETQLDVKQRDYAHTILQSAEAMLSLINDVLDFSKGEAGKLVFEQMDFDLRGTVASVMDLVNERARLKNLALLCTVEDSVPDYVCGDPSRLRQILINLLYNAVKFTELGHVALRVSMVPEPALESGAAALPALKPDASLPGKAPELMWLRFTVQDTGIGIAPEAHARIFQPFTQGDGSTTRRHGGAGMGLAICKQLVEGINASANNARHTAPAASIKVQSVAGAGATFEVDICFQRAHPRKATQLPQLEAHPASTGQALNLRVLLVEDNATNQKVTLQQLHRLGHQAHAVSNGIEALQITEKIPYDVILMDCQMPEMDGYEATRLIRARETLADAGSRGVWIIAMTAHSLEGARQKCLAAGMNDFLGKPARITDIQNAINRSDLVNTQENQPMNTPPVANQNSGAQPAPQTPSAPPVVAAKAESGESQHSAPTPSRGQLRAEVLQELQELSPDLISNMSKSFRVEVPPCIQELERLLAAPEKDGQTGIAMGRAAHKVKGGAGNFGAEALERICQQIEVAGGEQDFAKVKVLSAEMSAEYEAVLESLDNFLKQPV